VSEHDAIRIQQLAAFSTQMSPVCRSFRLLSTTAPFLYV